MYDLTNETLVAAARAGILAPATPIPFLVEPAGPGSAPRWHTDPGCTPQLGELVAVTAAELTGRDVFADPGTAGWLVCTVCTPQLGGFAPLSAPAAAETTAWLAAADRIFRDPAAADHPADTAGAASFLLGMLGHLDVDPAARSAVDAAAEGLATRLTRALGDPAPLAAADRELLHVAADRGDLPDGFDAGSASADAVLTSLRGDRVWALLSLSTSLTWGIGFPAQLLHAGFHGVTSAHLHLTGERPDRWALLSLPRAVAGRWSAAYPGTLVPAADVRWPRHQLLAALTLADRQQVASAGLWDRLATLLPAVAATESSIAGG